MECTNDSYERTLARKMEVGIGLQRCHCHELAKWSQFQNWTRLVWGILKLFLFLLFFKK